MTEEIAKQAAEAERAAIVAWLDEQGKEFANQAILSERQGDKFDVMIMRNAAVVHALASGAIKRGDHHIKGSE